MQLKFGLPSLAAIVLATPSFAQSTATLAGTVTDPTGAVLPGASITVHNNGTGADRTVVSDKSGQYVVPSLSPGDYTVTLSAAGFGSKTVKGYVLQVDQKANLDVPLGLASAGETVQVEGTAPVIQAETITVGEVIDARTVQEIPLNGRHFLDLTTLTPGGVTAPANGSLTAPSRGLGANSFNTAGNREDSVNFQINGVNLNDMVQNQITFQPSINTTSEFKINNQTYSAEYGRSSGSIVNVSTRSGTNQFHGEVFEYIRNNALDARNYFNPKGTQMAQLNRSNFGASVGGPIYHDHTFFFVSYEGLRQKQGILTNTTVLTQAQRDATTNAVSRNLLQFIPLPNATTGPSSAPNAYVATAPGPVRIDQGTADVQHIFNPADTVHGFYALQEDTRTEPTLQGNNIPGFGDLRHAQRQILTINETHVFNPRVVNEARLGFNRINISFNPANLANPTALGLATGTVGAVGLPQTTITGIGVNFGGPSGFPQGRADTLAVFSDALTVVAGKHSIKSGGEFRRFINANFTGDAGLLGFNSVAAFQQGLASSYAVTPSLQTNRIFVNAAAGFVQDSFKATPNLLFELGFRFEWNGSPTAGTDAVSGFNKFVVFNPAAATLTQVGTNGLGRSPYKQNFNYEPRVGFSYDVFGSGKTVVRAAYGYMADQPETNAVSALASNPPFSNRVSYSSAATLIPLATLFNSAAAAGITVSAIQPDYHNAYTQTFNFNLQQALGGGVAMSIGYYGSVGRHLRQPLNINQPNALGVRPYQAIAANSPIRPLANISGVNISQVSNVGQSNYNAMWTTVQKNFRSGLQFEANYSYSKSLDLGSLTGTALQDNTRPYLNYGPSDFDTTHRVAAHAVYNLPFKGNRLVEGFKLTGIAQWQTGNPLNVTTTSTFTGTANVLHPNLLAPVTYPRAKSSATAVQWFSNSVCTQLATTAGCVFQIPTTGFGNLSRNALRGPGFSDIDVSLEKDTKIHENLNFQIRLDAFDVVNHASFGNPNTNAVVPAANTTSNFGIISATRFPVGDLGSSRQLQVAAKIVF